MINIEGAKKYRSYKLTFVSATDTKPKRIRILDELMGNRIFIPYAYDKDFVSASLLSDDFSKSL